MARSFVDDCIAAPACDGKLDVADRRDGQVVDHASTQCRVVDECLQLFGGYGYMSEYPIARMYADARVQRIYGGANEVMKENRRSRDGPLKKTTRMKCMRAFPPAGSTSGRVDCPGRSTRRWSRWSITSRWPPRAAPTSRRWCSSIAH